MAPAASVDGAIDEDKGSSVVVTMMVLGSAVVRTMLGSIGGGTTLTSEPASATSAC